MSTNQIPAMKTDPKFIFFSDFDGTITLRDSYGEARRLQENKDTLNGKNAFRDSFQGMMDSITLPYNELISMLVANIKLDPYFKRFFDFALAHNIPVVVLSSGMVPIIRALLEHLVGPDSSQIQIVANDVRAKPGKSINETDGWDVAFHDDSDFGHDKSLTIRPYAQLPEEKRPVLFYAGDGVSDFSAAKETDLLFAKEGKDLVTFCARDGIPFTTFKDWKSINETVQELVEGKKTVKDAAKEGFEEWKRSQKK